MDGDIPDLPKFIEVKQRHHCWLMIDEAHSIGVLGAKGGGIGNYYQVNAQDVDMWMGTLSKAFASCGGYIAGSKALIEYLKYTAPGFVYSVGISPPNAAAALAAIQVLEEQPERIQALEKNAQYFLNLARHYGFNTGTSHQTPIIPVIIGNSLRCMQLAEVLFTRGINVQPMVYPSVAENGARLRFFLSATHTHKQIEYTLQVLKEELDQL
jgi:7-keto-8-aminopelargonate synthetase-like enzyme